MLEVRIIHNYKNNKYQKITYATGLICQCFWGLSVLYWALWGSGISWGKVLPIRINPIGRKPQKYP